MFQKSLFTTDNWAGLILRLTLGFIIFPHGAQKLAGWFGGFGYAGSMQYFTQTAHLPYLIGFLTIMFEFFGTLLLIAGLATRINAFCCLVVFLGAITVEQGKNGFFMNWFGQQKGEGIEFSLLVLGISLALLVLGGGRYSVDRYWVTRRLVTAESKQSVRL